jgi:hypothetical protein
MTEGEALVAEPQAELETGTARECESEGVENEEEMHGSEEEHTGRGTDGSGHDSEGSSVKSAGETGSHAGEGAVFEEVEEKAIDPEFQAKFESVKAQFIEARNQSISIQRKLLELFPALGFEDSTSAAGISDFPNRYQNALDRLEIRRTEFETIQQRNQSMLTELEEECEEADRRRYAKEAEFLRMREDSGYNAVMLRTNKLRIEGNGTLQ